MLTGLGLTSLTERANLGRAGNNMAWIYWKFKLGRVKNAGLTGRRFISVSGYGDGRDRSPLPWWWTVGKLVFTGHLNCTFWDYWSGQGPCADKGQLLPLVSVAIAFRQI